MRARRGWMAGTAVAVMVVAGACGSDGDGADEGATSGTTSPAAGAAGGKPVTKGDDGYTPVSDVAAHAAIGIDAKEIRGLMEPATSGGTVDWAAVATIFAEGRNSKKGDGLRALAALAPDDPVSKVVSDAIGGTGSAAGAADAVRRQKVDKGVTVILERKVLGELDAAVEKVADGKTDPASGAPHSVDEAWAFYTAEGHGPAATAAKRAGDFKKDGKVHEAVIAALSAAQSAAMAGDAAALHAAVADVEAALDYIFYLATFKYLDTMDDAVTRAEGETFYLAIQPELRREAAEADTAITGAFGSNQAAAGRSALNGSATLAVLGIGDEERVSSMP